MNKFRVVVENYDGESHDFSKYAKIYEVGVYSNLEEGLDAARHLVDKIIEDECVDVEDLEVRVLVLSGVTFDLIREEIKRSSSIRWMREVMNDFPDIRNIKEGDEASYNEALHLIDVINRFIKNPRGLEDEMIDALGELNNHSVFH